MKTLVWTDGSCNAEGVAGHGGWAALIERDGSTEQLVGSAMETTQNRMELTAVCEALERVNGAIEVRTDSKYIEKCFSEGWHIRWRRDDKWRTTKGPVKNRGLWERLFALVEDDARDVSFVWVKGHRDEANNNHRRSPLPRCFESARQELNRLRTRSLSSGACPAAAGRRSLPQHRAARPSGRCPGRSDAPSRRRRRPLLLSRTMRPLAGVLRYGRRAHLLLPGMR
jgi:ribonuclease HI